MAATVTRRMGLAFSVIRDNCAFHSGVSPQLPLAQSIVDHLILACRYAYRSLAGRGLLAGAADGLCQGWPGWLVVAYTTFWFGLSHPLLLASRKGAIGFAWFHWHGVHRRFLVNRIFEKLQLALADSQSLCGRFAQCQRYRFLESRHFGEMNLIHP